MPTPRRDKRPQHSSWEPVEKWYNGIVGKEGHHYHQQIVIPGVLKLLDFKRKENESLLDLACGQGVLARSIPKEVGYCGVDISQGLIAHAKEYDSSAHHEFLVADITKPLALKKKEFSHASIVLALQNVEKPEAVFKNAFRYLVPGGKFAMVLNHPCFRIPRQSSWKVDPDQKLQYRRVDRYMSPQSIPIQTNPGKGKESSTTLSYHYSLSAYSQWLYQEGFCILKMEEWCSDKVSTGGAAKMENRAREEFPLFLAILAQKPKIEKF